jgi:CMP-N-acetylneuraminate monooxygenase
VTPFGTWTPLDEFTRFMILQDGTGRNDSGILVEYKGHRILNTVDSQNLNNGILPRVEMLLTSFAGGASGYPVCWEDYSQQRRKEILQKKRHAVLLNVINMVTKTRPHFYVPFAGYFTEAHPADHAMKILNTKNTPEQVRELLRQHCPDTATWIPQPGATFDIGQGEQVHAVSVSPEVVQEMDHDFDPYIQEIYESRNFAPLQTQEGLRAYFNWAGFRGNMVLHVMETDEDFLSVVREFYVDFENLSFLQSRPEREHLYLRMRCRSDVFRHVLRNGLPWEEISIGFQARFHREPDIYEFDFWDHFQNKLPRTLPNWSNHVPC